MKRLLLLVLAGIAPAGCITCFERPAARVDGAAEERHGLKFKKNLLGWSVLQLGDHAFARVSEDNAEHLAKSNASRDAAGKPGALAAQLPPLAPRLVAAVRATGPFPETPELAAIDVTVLHLEDKGVAMTVTATAKRGKARAVARLLSEAVATASGPAATAMRSAAASVERDLVRATYLFPTPVLTRITFAR